MNKNIFIIEDDAALAGSLKAQFSASGFAAETNRGEQDMEDLINNIKKFNADIVVLDLILPKLDGFEIIKSIRGDQEISGIYVFVFTDVSDQDSKARGLKVGANQYFIKEDFSVEEFVEKVGKIIENKNALGENQNY